MATTTILAAGAARIVVLPTIHLGGTSAARLVDQYSDILVALRETRDLMTAFEPNMRDYLHNSTNERACALNQHGDRLNAIDRIIADYEALQSHAADVRDAK